MRDWKKILFEVDDDYLIGLANKGIVKRAHKDMEEGGERVVSMAEEAVVEAGGETVTVRFPLGESGCSCPSRTICRHVVRAILFLKAQASAMSEEKPAISAVLQQEINSYPIPALKKALGPRGFQDFAGQLQSGYRPQIQRTSIFTVCLPGQITVKLLSPLEYSTCTCHKKELCSHKAAAILWCRLEAGALKEEELAEEAADRPLYDREQVNEAAVQMKEYLEELMDTGLSRISPDVPAALERLAIIGHNARLASFEGDFRALSDSYDKYLKRAAALQIRELMGQTTRLYRQVCRALEAKTELELAGYAGEFKAEYISVGDMDLVGIAMEHFESQAGYEGDTVYFLEEHTGKWYTYTNSRPMFYDQQRRRGNMDKSQAPWGLPIPLEQMAQVRIRLTGAKADSRGRLSSSQSAKGEITGERGLKLTEIAGCYYNDFRQLFQEQILNRPAETTASSLVFLKPAVWGKAEFSAAVQKLQIPLFDGAGREVLLELTYSQKESQSIRYLERLSARLGQNLRQMPEGGAPEAGPGSSGGESAAGADKVSASLPYVLGKIRLQDNRIRLYPVALMEEDEIDDRTL